MRHAKQDFDLSPTKTFSIPSTQTGLVVQTPNANNNVSNILHTKWSADAVPRADADPAIPGMARTNRGCSTDTSTKGKEAEEFVPLRTA